MKFLFLALSLMLSPLAKADWFEVTPDHFNSVYRTDEYAEFNGKVFTAPTSPDFVFSIDVIDVTNNASYISAIETGFFKFVAAPMSAGTHQFIFKLRMIGPAGVDTYLETRVVELVVE